MGIDDGQSFVADLDQTLLPKASHGATDVDGRQAKRISNLLLCQRKIELVVLVHETDLIHPMPQLAQMMAYSAECLSLADIGQPFPKDRFIYESCAPERPLDTVVAIQEIAHFLDGNGSDHGIR